MDLLKPFRRPPPISDLQALGDFIDANAAFLMQKGIYEYSRARAGHYAKVLFAEADFREAVEQSRWRAYPIGLALVGEMVEATLGVRARDDRVRVLESLASLVLSVFDRYPTPGVLETEEWKNVRAELAHRLQLIGLHAPKRVMDIPETLAEAYFNLMPIHEKLRGRDFATMRNYLRITLCNIHDELTKRADEKALVAALLDEKS